MQSINQSNYCSNTLKLLTRQWQQYITRLTDYSLKPVNDIKILSALPRVWAASPFVANYCINHPDKFAYLVQTGQLTQARHYCLYQKLYQLTEDCDEKQLAECLRVFKTQQMIRIAWRDLSGVADLDETLEELSQVADSCIQIAALKAYAIQTERWGIPCDENGLKQELLIFAMGKLGAHELNFSSDVDLIYCYPKSGQTTGPRKRSNEEFFRLMCIQLNSLLHERTAEGYVYRVDLRLRPYGKSGPTAMSFAAMEDYYQFQGREWERYALIKARLLTGSINHRNDIEQRLNPFIYRRYTDFGVLDALRDLKSLINQQVKDKRMENNIKLGMGGIREIEFIGQCFQLLHGGKRKYLQIRPLLKVLAILARENLLPEKVKTELVEAYTFLRQLENRIQAYNDQQKHDLPDQPEIQEAFARSMDFGDWQQLNKKIRQHRQNVAFHFEQLLNIKDDSTSSDILNLLELKDYDKLKSTLKTLGFKEAGAAVGILTEYYQHPTISIISKQAKKRLKQFIPLLLKALTHESEQILILQRICQFLLVITRRSAYISLLRENPKALQQLILFAKSSAWIMQQLEQMPLLLDECIDPRILYAPIEKNELATRLKRNIANANDYEAQLTVLREFKQANVLRIAASDVSNTLSTTKVSDLLTELAELLLTQVVELATEQLPETLQLPNAEFAIIAYGKFGGLELSYGSDLDLVFIYHNLSEENSNYYYSKLVQKMISLFNMRTISGILYDIDLRLRPNGQSGLLVSSIGAYHEYLEKKAWNWELQALVRSRAVYGNPCLIAKYEHIRQAVICKKRDKQNLTDAIHQMRLKMQRALFHANAHTFDLKQQQGGIVDIEFIVQYLVLYHAHNFPNLCQFSDNLRQLDTLHKNNLITESEQKQLTEAYLYYRKLSHQLILQQQSQRITINEEITDHQSKIKKIYHHYLQYS